MRTLNTILGEVIINNVGIARASGYGQYKIIVDITFEGESKIVKIHSTDSQLFDNTNDQESDKEMSEYLLENSFYVIERGVQNYIESL